MNRLPGAITKVYGLFLKLYPRSFRNAFEEQMLLDFSDMAEDAMELGRFSFLLFCVQELVHFPASLFISHFEEGALFKVIRYQPVNFGWRSAAAFGAGLAASSLAISAISAWLFTLLDPQISFFSVWVYDRFQIDNGGFWFSDGLSLLATAITGIIFGVLFAFFTGQRRKYFKYMLAGALGWFIPVAISFTLSRGFVWSFFLSTTQTQVLGLFLKVLTGAFLGLIFYIAENNRYKPAHFMLSAILYPLSVYLYIKILFHLWLEITPWLFTGLLALLLFLLGSVFLLARLSGQFPWAVVAGVVGYPLLYFAISYVANMILKVPTEPGGGFSTEMFLLYQRYWMVGQACLGMLLGLLLGLIIGFQNRNKPHPPVRIL
jgi:hypothetical protein